jgi:hypothetical protein
MRRRAAIGRANAGFADVIGARNPGNESRDSGPGRRLDAER